jgi:hypothetical protein
MNLALPFLCNFSTEEEEEKEDEEDSLSATRRDGPQSSLPQSTAVYRSPPYLDMTPTIENTG